MSGFLTSLVGTYGYWLIFVLVATVLMGQAARAGSHAV
jgi:hypothetical protein